MSQTSILSAFEDSQVPAAAPLRRLLPMMEGQGRDDPASQVVTRAVLLRWIPWLLLLLWTVLVLAVVQG